MYTVTNYKTKKAVKESISKGDLIEVYQPNNVFNVEVPSNGTVYLEGPHYPQPHRWYGEGTIKDGYLVKIV